MSNEMRTFMRLVEAAELEEMPIANFSTIGDFTKPTRGFKKPEDRALVTNPKAVQNLFKKFANNQFGFNFIIVNMPEAGKHAEKGMVTQDWLMANMPKSFPQMAFKHDSINVIYVGNAAAERYPFTPWIIAHRMGHAFSRYPNNLLEYIEREIERTAKAILKQYNFDPESRRYQYDSYSGYGGGGRQRDRDSWQAKQRLGMLHFYQNVGTFKSARDRNLREPFEFVFECFAQFLMTGKVQFNHLGRCIQTGTGGWGRKEQSCLRWHQGETKEDIDYEIEGINQQLDDLAEMIASDFHNALSRAVGKIFVM